MTFFNGASMAGEMLLFGLAVYEVSHSTTWVGLALALYFAPNFVVGAFAGALSDTFDRVRVLRAVEAALGINLFLIGALIANGAAGLVLILVLTFVSGVWRATYNPARASYAFDLAGAGRIVSVLGALNIAMRLGQLGGAFAAGWVAVEVDIGTAYMGLASAHVLALLALGRQRAPPPSPGASRPSMRTGLIELGRELLTNRTLLVLVMVTAAVEVLGFSFLTALPEIAIDRLGLDAAGLGVLHASRSAGGIAGGILMGGPGPPPLAGNDLARGSGRFRVGGDGARAGAGSTHRGARDGGDRDRGGGERRVDPDHDAARGARGDAWPRDGSVAVLGRLLGGRSSGDWAARGRTGDAGGASVQRNGAGAGRSRRRRGIAQTAGDVTRATVLADDSS